ncbi:dTDP-4-dehydrorhamnose 3,5-epimerase family protein [Ferviditalea candida]|uniref:dTDP-4-dehydrorhamnose 3,5-epimerase family protein n=1 Tax=Ferviditalea candida TaxID=3108399 RepID=A0ABU5ZD49_9BACL|nr:dTDP-4-dehydrorhamnose 3,5-epimerase family protein [Paenibacillaceae bacterium T2]
MIEGVRTKSLIKHCDDRGYFAELLREDDAMFERFGQASQSMSYPGVIKAFHYHEHQDDIWHFASGNAQVVLHDLRRESPTFGQTDVHYLGEQNPCLLFIPRGVAHGYRVLGNMPAVIIYFTNTAYDPRNPDEHRIPYDDESIGFNWQTKFR